MKKAEDEKFRPALAVCLTGARHNFEDGDEVLLEEIVGLSGEKKSVNGEIFKVTVVNPEKFVLQGLDLAAYSAYDRNGVGKQLKQKVTMEFEEWPAAVKAKKFDANLWISDFEKMGHWDALHLAFQHLLAFKKPGVALLPDLAAR